MVHGPSRIEEEQGEKVSLCRLPLHVKDDMDKFGAAPLCCRPFLATLA